MAINLRDEITAILASYGHDIILQRKTPDGKGWTNRLEKHTVRHNYPATRDLPTTMEERPEGKVNTIDILYYFRWDAKPNEGDRIYELDDRFDGRSLAGQTTWLIDYALPMRGKLGRIVYYICGVTREAP